MVNLRREVVAPQDATWRKNWNRNYDRNVQFIRLWLIIINIAVIIAALRFA